MIHLNIYNTSCGRKKGWQSKWQFDFRPLKFRIRLEFHACKGLATYIWKSLDNGYKFFLISPQSNVYTKSYRHLKWRESQFWDSQFGSPKKNDIWVQPPMASHREYYKGEGDHFLQVRTMVNLMSSCMHVAHLCTKSAPIMH
jgi:hypothetical protein